MSLKDKTKSFKKDGIKFMEGRTKGDSTLLFDRIINVMDYDFIKGDDGEYLVYIIDEDDKSFYFGGEVLTKNFKEFTSEEKKELQEFGLPIRLRNKKGKKHNYTSVEYYPDDETTTDDLPF